MKEIIFVSIFVSMAFFHSSLLRGEQEAEIADKWGGVSGRITVKLPGPSWKNPLLVCEDGGLANVIVRVVGPAPFPVHPDLLKQPKIIHRIQVVNDKVHPKIILLRRGIDTILPELRISFSGDKLLFLEPNKEYLPRYYGGHPEVVSTKELKTEFGYVLSLSNPYGVVTSKNGRFSLNNLPSNRDLVLKFWHELASEDEILSPDFNIKINVKADQTIDLGDLLLPLKILSKE